MTGHVDIEMTHAERDDGASGARQLGRVVSLAARIEPELIRAARLRLLPHLDVSAEVDLWFSPLVQSRTPLAIVLRTETVDALRAELAEDLRLLDGAWDVLQAMHENAPPVLRLEEELTWLGLRGQRSDADVNDLLRQAVYSMIDQDRSGIARWTARAFDRLPQPVKRHEAARMLNVGAKARVGSPIDPAEAQDAPWLSWVVPSNLPSIPINVRLLEGAVEIGSEASEWSHQLDVPKTNPPFVEVSWEGDQLTHSRQVPIPEPVTPVVVVTGTTEARIRTALGHAFQLSRREDVIATPGRFLDFDLRFEASRGPSDYRVTARGPAGEATGSFKVPLSDIDLENFILKIGRARAVTREGTRGSGAYEVDLARTFGQRLFSAVMDGDVGQLYRAAEREARAASQGLRLTLSMGSAPALASIPWEFLYDQPAFLSLSSQTPVIRSFDLPSRRRLLVGPPPLQILGVVSSPSDLGTIDVKTERDKFEQALRPLVDGGAVAIEWLEVPSLVALVRALRNDEYHVLHFVGHGGFRADASDGALAFEDDSNRVQFVSGDQLATVLMDSRTLRLVILNKFERAQTEVFNPFSSVAASLIQREIPAVVGMQFEMTDRATIVFAREFYSAMAGSKPVDTAISDARRAIFADGNDVEWATPVLYSSVPDGRIFDLHGDTRPDAQSEPPLSSAS